MGGGAARRRSITGLNWYWFSENFPIRVGRGKLDPSDREPSQPAGASWHASTVVALPSHWYCNTAIEAALTLTVASESPQRHRSCPGVLYRALRYEPQPAEMQCSGRLFIISPGCGTINTTSGG